MHILSIDVGIRNLAYVIIETIAQDHHTIVDWNVLELIEPHEKAAQVDNVKIGKNMCAALDDVLKDKTIDKILIEPDWSKCHQDESRARDAQYVFRHEGLRHGSNHQLQRSAQTEILSQRQTENNLCGTEENEQGDYPMFM